MPPYFNTFFGHFASPFSVKPTIKCFNSPIRQSHESQALLKKAHFPPISVSLCSNHVPVRFAFSRPPRANHRGLHFASVVRWESKDALVRGQRTRSRTVRTFHQGDATVSKPFEVDGNHAQQENVHLGDVLFCTCSFAVSTVSAVFVVEARAFSETVCRSGSFPFTRVGSALF
jgi:hypothetical protein